MNILRRMNRALISERGAAVVKGVLVAALCLMMIVAAGIVAGAIAVNFPLIQALSATSGRRGGLDPLILAVPLIYVVLCAAGAVARLRYGK